MPAARPAAGSGYQIDTTNSLATGLLIAIAHAADGNVLAGGMSVPTVAVANDRFRVNLLDPLPAGLDASDVAAFSRCHRNGQPGFNYQLTIATYYKDSADFYTPSWQHKSTQDGGDRTRLTFFDNSFSGVNDGNAVDHLDGATHDYGLSHTASNQLRGFRDGSLNSTGNLTFRADSRKRIQSPNGNQLSAEVFFFWGRAISDAEHASVAADPYQLFIPADSFNPAWAASSSQVVQGAA